MSPKRSSTPQEMEVSLNTIVLISLQTLCHPFLLQRLRNVLFSLFSESGTPTAGTEYARLSKSMQDLKENVSSLKEDSVSEGFWGTLNDFLFNYFTILSFSSYFIS